MTLLVWCVLLFGGCLTLLLSLPQLRACSGRMIRRWAVKQQVYDEDPETHSAASSWGRTGRSVNGQETPAYQFRPEQIETGRFVKERQPSRFVEGQSRWWTILFYALLLLMLASILLGLVALRK